MRNSKPAASPLSDRRCARGPREGVYFRQAAPPAATFRSSLALPAGAQRERSGSPGHFPIGEGGFLQAKPKAEGDFLQAAPPAGWKMYSIVFPRAVGVEKRQEIFLHETLVVVHAENYHSAEDSEAGCATFSHFPPSAGTPSVASTGHTRQTPTTAPSSQGPRVA